MDNADNAVRVHPSRGLLFGRCQALHGPRFQHRFRNAVCLDEEFAVLVQGGEVEFPQVFTIGQKLLDFQGRGVHPRVVSLIEADGHFQGESQAFVTEIVLQDARLV